MRLLFVACWASLVWAYDFSFCQKYYKDASNPIANTRAIYIEYQKEKFFVAFFKTPPENVEILKADPFIGLYAFKLSPKSRQQSYMLMPLDSKALSLNMASLGFKSLQKGIILKPQRGFLQYAQFSAEIPTNGVVSNICYQIYGLGVGKNQFIESKYLNRFLSQKQPYYGDIGVRLYRPNPKQKALKIEYVDPFFPNVPFLKDDEILQINQQPLKDYYDFEWLVSNLDENSIAEVKIKRKVDKKDQIFDFKVKVQKRYGGFLLPDIFFDRIGIKLNDQLEIIETDPQRHNLQQELVQGDVILWINGQKIFDYTKQSQEQIQARIRYLLTQAVTLGKLDILISRDGFQFTLNLINGLQNEYIKNRYNPFGF